MEKENMSEKELKKKYRSEHKKGWIKRILDIFHRFINGKKVEMNLRSNNYDERDEYLKRLSPTEKSEMRLRNIQELEEYKLSYERETDCAYIIDKAFKDYNIMISFDEFIKAYDDGSLDKMQIKDVAKVKENKDSNVTIDYHEQFFSRISDIEGGNEFFESFIDFLKKDSRLDYIINELYKEKADREIE